MFSKLDFTQHYLHTKIRICSKVTQLSLFGKEKKNLVNKQKKKYSGYENHLRDHASTEDKAEPLENFRIKQQFKIIQNYLVINQITVLKY